jgi:transposase-like protein
VLTDGATNAIESVRSRLRKIIKTRGHFPSDDAASKLIWLALRSITADWSRAAREWKLAMNQFAILFEERFMGSTGAPPAAWQGPEDRREISQQPIQ